MDETLANILLVEDDQVDQETVKRIFKKYHVLNPLHVANDGIEAMELLQKAIPHILLLDINMPRMDGISLLQKIRSTPPLENINVFILTTSDSRKDVLEALNLDVAAYIIKPLRMEKFFDAAARLDMHWALQVGPAGTVQ